ncbi:MAG: hypothetical protein AABM66_11230 [Actinomycetota bacterium]
MSSSSMSRRDGGAFRRAGLTVALALAALAVVPAIASAASVTFTTANDTITYTGGAGETNSVVIDDSSSTSYTFAETGISESPNVAECTDGGDVITCTFGNGNDIDIIVANMGDMGDTANASGLTTEDVTINGEAGGDTLSGGSDDDELNGGDGDDNLYGGSDGADDINGDAGNDRMDGGQGDEDDDYDGGNGTGIDRVVYGILDPPGALNFSYTCTSQPVNVTMNNLTGDDSCADSSKDDENVRDSVESITGSTLGDTITGSCFANTFAGDPGSASGNAGGNDTLNGDPATGCAPNGADFFGGGEGNDVFNGDGAGTAGFDTVTYGFPYTGNTGISVDLDDVADDNDGFGNTADNVNGDIERVIGNTGGDTINATAADQAVSLFGRAGVDTLTDSAFGDYLNGEGGADTYNCPNGGSDTYVQDGSDTVNTVITCEIPM